MTLDEWLAEERDRLERFAKMWREGQASAKAAEFPADMEPSDWDEALAFFAS